MLVSTGRQHLLPLAVEANEGFRRLYVSLFLNTAMPEQSGKSHDTGLLVDISARSNREPPTCYVLLQNIIVGVYCVEECLRMIICDENLPRPCRNGLDGRRES